MVSKNNIQVKDRYATKQVPHYGIRKLSVGVASVLLSTTLYMGVTAHTDAIAATNPQQTIDQTANTKSGTSTSNVPADAQPTADQSASTAANSPASETDTSDKAAQTVLPKQPDDKIDVQPASGQSESVAATSNAPENNGSAVSASTVLPKQPANADTQSTATMSGVKPFVNLAVESDNNDLTPTHETIDSKWTLHYVNQADHKQELKDPTVITMQYTRTNTPQSDGTTQYGDWSYVPDSFKQTGTPITVKDSNNPVKQDNVDKNGENFDVFTITAMYPAVTGYGFYNGINGTRLHDNLRNNERQADSMSKDFYAEYDVAKERSVAVKFVDDQSFDPDSSDLRKQVGQAITVTGRDGDTVNLKLTVPDKYQLADGQQLPTTYTFAKGSGDLKIHLVHKVVQREAAIDVQLGLLTLVHTSDNTYEPDTITQARWKQLEEQFGDKIKNSVPGLDAFLKVPPSVKVGTLAGHVDYDLVDERVTSLGDDWTTLNLGGKTYQLPNGDEVVNGIRIDGDDAWGKSLKELYLKYQPNIDPDYVNRPWHGYLSVNATNNDGNDDNDFSDIARSMGLQAGLVGDEPNALTKATGDRAATSVEMSNKNIDLNLLQGYDFDFSEQDGQLRGNAVLPVSGVYVPYVEKTATRTINVTTPDGKTTAVKQTATLAKQVNFGKDAHPAWTTGEWANYDVPTIPGYTASQSQIAKTAVTGTTEDQTVNITYTANPQTATVVYQSEDGISVHTTTVNGHTGQTVKVSNEVPTGWHLVNGKVPSEITFAPNGTPQTVVTIDHNHVTVTPDAPKTTSDKLPDNPDKTYPTGVSETDLNKTVTRTIKVTTPDGQTKTVEQTAKLTRTADVDEVTGEVKYGNWTTGEWASYDAPVIPGYTASQSNVTKETVTGTTKDQTVNITYTANEHQISVEYVDNVTGQVVKTDHMSGKTGQTVSITPSIPDGWELVSGQSVPSEVTLGADGAPTTVIKVQPQERSVAVKFVDDQSFDPDSSDLRKQVGQAITVTGRDGDTVDLKLTVPDKYQLADGQQLPTTYTFAKGSGDLKIHLAHKVAQREATVDVQVGLVTAVRVDDAELPIAITITQNQWTQLDDKLKDHGHVYDKIYPSVKVGTLTGHVDYDLVDNKVVSDYDLTDNKFVAFGDDWTTLNLGGQTYQMPDGAEVVNGISVEPGLYGKSFKKYYLKYHPDVDPDYINRPWHGYLSVNATNDFLASELDSPSDNLQVGLVGNEPNALAKANGDQAATAVKTANKTVDLSLLQRFGFETRDFSERNGRLQASAELTVGGVYIPYVEKIATRTINVKTPDGKTTTVKQTATLAKQVDFGKDAHPAWTTSEWSSYEVPTIPGYTASQSNVAKETVTSETKDQTVNITYTANPQTIHVNYVDIQGKLIHTTTVTGQTNQTVEVPSEVPTGWKLVDGQTIPSEVTFGPDGHADTSVKIEHRHVTVTPDKPQANGTKLPDNSTQSFHGVEASDLNKTVTRTIKVTTPDGQTNTIKQTVKLTRNATVDEVTGDANYGDWSTGQWDAYKVPTVAGYTATQADVAATSVDEHTTDQTVDVSYAPNKQMTTVKYVDDKGEVVHTTTVDGVTNQTVKVPSEVPAGWTITKGQVPSEITFGADGHEPIEVTVVHKYVTVTPEHPQDNGTKLPDNPAKTFNGVEINDLNKTITRIIKVTTPDGQTKTVDQTVKLTRSADIDEATGEVTYGDWTTGEWAKYDVPSVAGYTPSQVKVDKETVTAASKETTIVITYAPNQHQINVEYIDDDAHGKVVKTDQVPGKTDQTITIKPSALTNYELVDNGNRTYTVTSADGQAVQIHVKHHQVKTNESKTVTRTINVHTPHDGTKVVKQTVDLNRDVTTDQVTGDKTYSDWTTGQWETYTPKAIPGYTPSTNEVPNVNVDGGSTDQTVDVTYTADAQKVEIVYVDDAKDGAVVKTDQISGKTDETIKVTPNVPTGYKVISEVPGNYTMTANGHQAITVHLGHQTKTTSESKTVTRTINVHTPHNGVKTVKQTADLTRDVTTDQVTGEKTYGDWSTTAWDKYVVPVVAGYVPSIKQVAQQVVNSTTEDQTIDVTYSSGEHTTHINYVDGGGKVVHITTIKGQTDGTVQVPNETPAGWTVVDESVPTELVFGPDGHAAVMVTISHKHVTVTSDQPKTSDDKLPDNPALTFHGVGHDDLNKTVVRTIKVTTPDGQTKTVDQTAQLTRTADVDEVTGDVTYSDWTTDEWSHYDASAAPGYTPSQNEVPATKVTDTTKNQTVTVTYTANDQTTTINYVDQNGKVVHTTVVNGHTDQTVKVPNETPSGWAITDGRVPSEVTFGPDGHDHVIVTISHKHITVTPDKPQTDGTKLPDNSNQTFHGVEETDLNKTITRTIKVTTPTGKTDTIKQTAKLTRTANVDEVTGEVAYGKWTTAEWPSYEVPVVPGYTPSQAVVAEVAVNADITNQTVKIAYTTDSHTTHINYIDDDGKIVHTTMITGQTDQTVKVPNEVPAGWTIAGNQVPSEITFGADGHDDVAVTVDHKTVIVASDDPKTDGTQLPDNPALTFNGVDHDDLNRIVTRTIPLHLPGQDPQVITQIAHLTRTATVDEVTGDVTYGDWTSGQWDTYEVPNVNGYTADQTMIPAVKVTSETTSQTITINYVAVPVKSTVPSKQQPAAKQATTTTPTAPLQTPVATGTVQKTKQNTVKNSAQSTTQDTKQLPQTGNDEQANLLSIIGGSLMTSLALFGLGKKKKHKN